MKKLILTTLLITIVFFQVVPFGLLTPQTVYAIPTQEQIDAIPTNTPDNCTGFFEIECGFYAVLRVIALIPVTLTGLLVQMTGTLLNLAIVKTVIGLGTLINGITGIDEAWRTLRDLANIFFIFGLLVIAISTILGLQNYGYKKLLARLIIIALIINFSMFFTKFVIDTSNIFAAQFYKAIAVPGTDGTTGIANAFTRNLGLTSAWNTKPLLDTFKKLNNTEDGSIALLFSYVFFVSVFFSITAFVFLFAAIMLIVRAIGFILLIILSPLAFAAMILPSTEGIARDWWKYLWQYALFAPLLMLFFWITLTIIPEISGTGSLINSFSSSQVERSESLLLILNFMIIIGFMIASIVVSNKLSLAGSKGITGFGKKIGKNIGGYALAKGVGGSFKGAGYLYNRMAALGATGAEKGATYVDKLSKGTGVAGTATRALGTLAKYSGVALAGRGIAATVRSADQAVSATLKVGEGAKYGGSMSYKDTTESAEKREREISDVQRDIQAKRSVKEAKKGTATQEELDRIASFSQRQLEEIGATSLTTESIAQHLTAEQLESINKNDKFSEQEKVDIITARFAEVMRELRGGNKKPLRGLTDKEVELLGSQNLRDAQVVQGLSPSQHDAIKKSSKVNSNVKKHIKDKRTEHLNDAIAGGTIEDEIRGMSSQNIAKLDDDILTHNAVMRLLTPAVLMEMAKEKNMKVRKTIRDYMSANHSATSATDATKNSQKWLTQPDTPLGMIF